MIFDDNELASAVLFFDALGEIFVEMNLAEFQAVLDGFVPLEDLAGQQGRACYVEFNCEYYVKKLVFFLLPVNSRGEVEKDWQLPLMDLASKGRNSKDLGAGPVSLVCQSSSPAEHLKPSLWNPDLGPRGSHLNKVKRCIEDNRLGVQFRQPPDGQSASPTFDRAKFEQELTHRLRKEYAQEFRDHVAQLLKEQRLRMSTTRSEFEDSKSDIKRDYERRFEFYELKIERLERKLSEQQQINGNLKETVDGQHAKIEGIREYYERKLADVNIDDSADELKEAIEAELAARFESESKELKELLQAREVELLYRNELEVQLHDEVARLRELHQNAISNTGQQLLSKMIDSGLSFVAYHAGPGHLTVPLNELAKYMDSPTAYAAEKSGVNVERYEAWLVHYRMPVCRYTDDEGNMCGENLERIENPLDFALGESDCCNNCTKRKARAHLRIAGS